MGTKPNEAIYNKIRKIHALAERAGTEAEAAVAAARVQELLAKHNLELGEVVLKQDPGAQMVAGREWTAIPEYARTLGRTCDDMFDVMHFFQGRANGWKGHRWSRARHFVFLGLKANVEAAVLTYEYLMESVDALARGAKSEGLIYGIAEFRAFRMGAADKICRMVREQKARTVAANPSYKELVHIGNSVAQKMHDAIKFGKPLRSNWAGTSFLSGAYCVGYEQGERVDVAGARTNRMLK